MIGREVSHYRIPEKLGGDGMCVADEARGAYAFSFHSLHEQTSRPTSAPRLTT
jgi:hypothetical protein